ncbi:hypothetical protein ACQRBF_06085, partial [Peptoniphilaceae bacterium SGI.131]
MACPIVVISLAPKYSNVPASTSFPIPGIYIVPRPILPSIYLKKSGLHLSPGTFILCKKKERPINQSIF